ncbi:hypothetical protein GL50803_0010705 [Giardia duodenalis]|uniref:Uncharacterized protein n=1 Tax=Giardia intestinalis (strain ATCC 50803 / WB clone C6) TaxID=184922 RepID=A8BD46_GIAIC|nr:hypothetical protein GL50803_0010705 [Giardia intestinalis]KAE8304184.1 hypothetical protein GL50803_0010705 [Giardia intestinalis]|eukprot:XP_001707718.1 Hypothetical protein GL50803_10705 [Giardia lamblia ATCC 50803]
MNDEDWKIEVPLKLKEQITYLSHKLQEVADAAIIVQERVLKCPTRNEVCTLLDHKVDLSLADRVESEVGDFIQSTQASIDSLKSFLQESIENIRKDVEALRSDSHKVLEFEQGYMQLQKETASIKELASTIRSESRKEIDSLQSGQGEIQKTIAALEANLSSLKGEIADMMTQQTAARDSFDDLKLLYQQDADRFSAVAQSIRSEVESAVAEIPKVISEAQQAAEQSVTSLIKQETERREADIQGLNNTVQMINSSISRIDTAQATLLGSFEDMKSSTLTDVQRMLDNTSKELRQYIDDTFLEFSSLKGQVQESMTEQRAALDDLASFSSVFQQADTLWKQHFEKVEEDMRTLFQELKQQIECDGVKVQDALATSISKTTQAHQLLLNTGTVWDTEWKDRELLVDETLTRLHRIVYEVDEAVASETNSRAAEFDVLRDVMERAFCTLYHQIQLKADADQVRRALWTKVDKLDV